MSEGLLWTLREAFASRKPQKVAPRQRARLAEMVAFERTHSPYYHELYRQLPDKVEDPTLLPVTSKRELMARFDAWTTDREVTIGKARAFAGNPDLIGERFLGKYTLATTSGTTGTPGIFVLDDRAMAVTKAMVLRMLRAWLGFGGLIEFLGGGSRTAVTIGPGSHSMTAVSASRLRKSASGHKRVMALSVYMPLLEMVARLNEFRPAMLGRMPALASSWPASRKPVG